MTNEINTLLEGMKKQGITAMVLFTGDPHGSEYLCAHYESVAHFTRFTGENARVLIKEDGALLWTDGRFFIQAKDELSGTGVSLMRSGDPGVESFEEYLTKTMTGKDKLGLELKNAPDSLKTLLSRVCEKTGAGLFDAGKLIDEAWADRPGVEAFPIETVDEKIFGGSVTEKLERLRRESGGGPVCLKALDNIMYLFNIRGRDIPYNPLAYSYAAVDEKIAMLYVYPGAVTDELKEAMEAAKVAICDYRVFDPKGYGDGDAIVEEMKAAKTPDQIENIRSFFELDSKAVICFLYELDRRYQAGEEVLTEKKAAEMIDGMRAKIPGFLGESFPTISAYGENAAMAHYEPDDKAPVEIKHRGLYLCDSGGLYPGVTTDVTRTVAVGEITADEKKAFTLVAAGWAELMFAVFKEGCTGRNLDILARRRLWGEGMDYGHGTGHGVGAGLCVHEGPQAIRWRGSADIPDAVLRPGMLITDEPGYYEEGAFGIRTENTLLVVRGPHEGFLAFEPLTLVPIDRRCLDLSLLSGEEISLIDDYHALVYERMKGYFEGDIREWLFDRCSKLTIEK